jgi:hypothetical protein
MGKGIDLARAAGAGLHADVLDDFKDQLLIVLLKRLAKDGKVSIPIAEVDDTGSDVVSFQIVDRVFHFTVGLKS